MCLTFQWQGERQHGRGDKVSTVQRTTVKRPILTVQRTGNKDTEIYSGSCDHEVSKGYVSKSKGDNYLSPPCTGFY